MRAGLFARLARGVLFPVLLLIFALADFAFAQRQSPTPKRRARQEQEAQPEDAVFSILRKYATNAPVRNATIAELEGSELEFLERLLNHHAWTANDPGCDAVFGLLAQRVFKEGKIDRVNRLLDLASRQTGPAGWRQLALLDGIVSIATPAPDKSTAPTKPLEFPSEPAAFAALKKLSDTATRSRLEKIDPLILWPGKPESKPKSEARPLTPEQTTRFKVGQGLYVATCGACHQPHGNGQEGLAPPLAGSEWTLGPEQRLVRIALHGLRGPLTVKGKKFEMDMPPLGVLDDDQIASILTYVRREWGHTADPIDPATVAKIRAETEKREDAWSEKELLTIP